MPTLRSLFFRLVDRASIFLRQAGTIILCVTLALWVLAHLPVVHVAGSAYTRLTRRQRDRPPRPLHRAGHCAAWLQLEDRIGLLSSVLAREVMVSTMGTLYGATPQPRPCTCNRPPSRHDSRRRAGADDLLRLRHAVHLHHGRGPRETNSWKWPAVQFLYMLVLAWGAAFAVNHIVMAIFG